MPIRLCPPTSGSTSSEPVAGVSNECTDYDIEDKLENNEHLIHIHVTNPNGIDNHLEEIR